MSKRGKNVKNGWIRIEEKCKACWSWQEARVRRNVRFAGNSQIETSSGFFALFKLNSIPMTICHLYDLGIWRHYSHSWTWKFHGGSQSKQDCPADETAHSWAAVVMVLFLWAKQLVFNRLPSLRQLTSTDAAGCVKTSFASKQLVFVFHLNFPRMVPFCRRWVQLPAGRHVNMCLTQVWRRVQFTFTFFSII